MNSKFAVLLAVGGAVIIFAADQPKKEPTEFDKLKAKVELLEGRVAQLESRVFALAQTRRTAFETPTQQLNLESAPPNIGEMEVNGLKVYKVPLAGTAK